jgi:hypothetical protein
MKSVDLANELIEQMSIGALRANMSARDRRLGIALNRDQLAVFVIDQLPAPYTTIRTNRSRHFGIVGFWLQSARALAHDLRAVPRVRFLIC